MATLPDLAAAKQWLRVEHGDDDPVINALLQAAASALEEETSLCFVRREVVQHPVAGFPASSVGLLKLWKGPVQSVTSITYEPASGGEPQALTSFRLREGRGGGLLPASGAGWPATASGPGAVRIEYVAGFDEGDLPPVLSQAVLQLTGHWYANRGESGGGMPGWIRAMVAPFGTVGLA